MYTCIYVHVHGCDNILMGVPCFLLQIYQFLSVDLSLSLSL